MAVIDHRKMINGGKRPRDMQDNAAPVDHIPAATAENDTFGSMIKKRRQERPDFRLIKRFKGSRSAGPFRSRT